MKYSARSARVPGGLALGLIFLLATALPCPIILSLQPGLGFTPGEWA